jgi:hypothetical protein
VKETLAQWVHDFLRCQGTQLSCAYETGMAEYILTLRPSIVFKSRDQLVDHVMPIRQHYVYPEEPDHALAKLRLSRDEKLEGKICTADLEIDW